MPPSGYHRSAAFRLQKHRIAPQCRQIPQMAKLPRFCSLKANATNFSSATAARSAVLPAEFLEQRWTYPVEQILQPAAICVRLAQRGH